MMILTNRGKEHRDSQDRFGYRGKELVYGCSTSLIQRGTRN